MEHFASQEEYLNAMTLLSLQRIVWNPCFFAGVFTEGGGEKKSLSGIKQRNALNPELCAKTEGVEEEKEEEGHSQCFVRPLLTCTYSIFQVSPLFSLLIQFIFPG